MNALQSYGAPYAPIAVAAQMGLAGAKRNRGVYIVDLVMPSRSPGSIKGTYAILLGINWEQYDNREIDLAEEEFKGQKAAFMKRVAEEPLFLAPYRGTFIASRDGQIVESDVDLHTVIDRFFIRYGDVPVYVGRVDGKRKVFIDSPNRVR